MLHACSKTFVVSVSSAIQVMQRLSRSYIASRVSMVLIWVIERLEWNKSDLRCLLRFKDRFVYLALLEVAFMSVW